MSAGHRDSEPLGRCGGAAIFLRGQGVEVVIDDAPHSLRISVEELLDLVQAGEEAIDALHPRRRLRGL